MGTDNPTGQFDGRRDYSRVVLVVVCAAALLLAATALVVLSPPSVESPAESALPVPEPEGAQSGGEGEASRRLGALSPGSSTDVGGTLGGRTPLRSLSTDVHFVATSPSPAYWRTAAYGNYTGAGWERPEGEPVPLDEYSVRGRSGDEFRYSIQMERAAVAVPSAWRPQAVDLPGATVEPETVLRANRSLVPGSTYEGVADRPPDDHAILQSAGQDYPEAIEERYTQLPNNTAAGVKPIADDITASASTPHEEVQAIESWLESEKAYTLNATHPEGTDPGVAFVRSMDAGYCEYFATGMVTMLRSQDIPARYVVGYSPGDRRDGSTAVVRGLNAHAWVEVYYPDVGWVRVDPTPSNERLERERAAVESDGGGPYRPNGTATGTPTPEGSPTPTPEPGASNGTDGSTNETTPEGTPTPTEEPGNNEGDGSEEAVPFEATLNRTAVPGATVEVTVTHGSVPRENAGVVFNGEFVGETDDNGTVTGTVPYAESLVIDVRYGSRDETDVVVTGGAGLPGTARATDVALGRLAQEGEGIPLETEGSLGISGDVITGQEISVTAVVEDVPLRNGTVTLDGEPVATTDRSGTATVTLPADPGSVDLAVTRGAVSGKRTLTLDAINVTAESTTLLPIAWGGMDVRATLGEEPLSGATVLVDGERVARTGPDGRATVTLPASMAPQLSVERYGQEASTTVTNPLLNLVLVGAAGLGLIGGAAVLARRREPGGGLRTVGLHAIDRVLGVLVGLATAIDGALGRLRIECERALSAVQDVAAGRRDPGTVLAALVERGRAYVDRLRAGAPMTGGASQQSAVSVEHERVREGWAAVVEASGVETDAHTPGEIACRAVTSEGLPPGPVADLRDSYRAVEYGGQDASEYDSRVEEAVAAIERALDDGAGDGSAVDSGAGDDSARDGTADSATSASTAEEGGN